MTTQTIRDAADATTRAERLTHAARTPETLDAAATAHRDAATAHRRAAAADTRTQGYATGAAARHMRQAARHAAQADTLDHAAPAGGGICGACSTHSDDLTPLEYDSESGERAVAMVCGRCAPEGGSSR